MVPYTQATLLTFFNDCDNGATNQIRGKAFEDLAAYLFETIPGIPFSIRNTMNTFLTEEIDVAIWNDRAPDGLPFLPHVILIECKNWSGPVSSVEVAWFATKLTDRGLDFGILIANAGITGNAADLDRAHFIIATNLAKGQKIIVITRTEISALTNTVDLITLIKGKICLLHVGGRII